MLQCLIEGMGGGEVIYLCSFYSTLMFKVLRYYRYMTLSVKDLNKKVVNLTPSNDSTPSQTS